MAMLLARRRALLAAAGLAGLGASALWIAVSLPATRVRPGVLEVTAIDVGQGDSLLLVSPRGRTLLVDSGGLPLWMRSSFDIGEQVVSPYLWSRGIRQLHAVAVTHGHEDHLGGMAAILANFHPRELWLGANVPTPQLNKLLHAARALGIRVVTHKAGDIVDFDGIAIHILAPTPELASHTWRPNDDLLAMRVTFGDSSALLEGDVERESEHRIAAGQPQAGLLKVAHHGSANATTAELLAAVRPRFAIISVGAGNVYGHPRREVLTRLAESGVATYRTDLNGAVTFYLDGKQVRPDLAALR
jgi:competence protein ComEC